MSSRSLNLVQLIGNLTRDPELRYTPNGTAVCTIGLATNRSWTTQDSGGSRQEETTYHRIVVWSKLAEICGKYLKKGSKVYVQGRLQNRKWTTKEGQEKETTEIVADNVIMLSGMGPREDMGGGNDSGYSYPEEKGSTQTREEASEMPAAVDSSAVDVTDDIPF
ncbi:single-stranded DNA-binding protein [Candidatus Cerribacteria bacterium 'Amazon FNV 2010 28 9']|uniref:Single-stranded DNA-binding protein n=1 Tax=Candidatus Cerribacteria bacterium 'Amazon FNV 2010 28 9' TaxID=2081795 RepID=A0A317JR07_9BACT|nr:MAG: single-stranded DNA-binding protein [Candidatus Cerribacteria bacterium 'Amazon FNV 2010 28 9']